jgi:hypothetical protein
VRRSSSPQRWETVASVGNINPDRVGSHWPPAPSGLMEVVASKYRGFRRTLRCLTMGPVVARPAVNGGIRYSSVRQLFHPPAEPGEIGQTPSIRAPSRFGPHSSGRSIASRQFGLDRLHLNLLAAWRTNPSSRIGPFSRIRPVEDQRVNKKGRTRGKTPGKGEDRQMPCNYGTLLK